MNYKILFIINLMIGTQYLCASYINHNNSYLWDRPIQNNNLPSYISQCNEIDSTVRSLENNLYLAKLTENQVYILLITQQIEDLRARRKFLSAEKQNQ